MLRNNIGSYRTARGYQQRDVVRIMRSCGYKWDAARASKAESGSVALSFGELRSLSWLLDCEPRDLYHPDIIRHLRDAPAASDRPRVWNEATMTRPGAGEPGRVIVDGERVGDDGP